MMYELIFMGGDRIDITEENANNLIGKTGLIAITGIGIINLSSVTSILPKGLAKSKEDKNRIEYSGGIAIKKFGKYIDEFSGAEVNLKKHPEILEKPEQLEAPSSFAKQLSEKI